MEIPPLRMNNYCEKDLIFNSMFMNFHCLQLKSVGILAKNLLKYTTFDLLLEKIRKIAKDCIKSWKI